MKIKRNSRAWIWAVKQQMFSYCQQRGALCSSSVLASSWISTCLPLHMAEPQADHTSVWWQAKLNLKHFVRVWLRECVHMSMHGLVFVRVYLCVSPEPSCSLPACLSSPPEGHSVPLSASNPVCPGEIEESGRPQRTRGAANTITSLSQTLNGALRLFNKAKRGRRDQFNTRPDSNGKRVNK